MVTVSEDRDPEERRGQQAVSPVSQAVSPVSQPMPAVSQPMPAVSQAVPPVRRAPISREWRITTRRGAYGAMVLALTVGYTWVSATRDWGWPLFPAAALLIVGLYVLLTTYVDQLPTIFRREYDNSTKYTLWFDTFSQGWIKNEDDPRKFGLRAKLTFSNGGNQIIQFIVERFDLDVKVDDADSVSGGTSSTTPFRLLPGRGKTVFFDGLGISEGTISGTIRYAINYGPPSGFPSYRRTHAIEFQSIEPITGDMVANSVERIVLDWWDLKPEEDEDLA